MLKKKRRKKRKSILYGFVLFTTLFYVLATLTLFLKTGDIIPERRQNGHAVASIFSGTHIQNVEFPSLYSSSAILVDLDQDVVLEEKKKEKKIYPASLTKIMTVLLAIEGLEDLDAQTTIPEDIYADLYVQEASMAGFQPGESASYRELLYGALLPSGAECCITLARAVAGSETAFTEIMNQKAAALDMKHTHFENATGLHSNNHYTTVEDLAKLTAYALKNEAFYQVFTSSYYSTIPSQIHPEGFTFYSTLTTEMEKAGIQDPSILGGKTGYTSKAGLCLASLAEIQGTLYLLVTVGAEGSHDTEPYHILDACAVYDTIRSLQASK